MKILDRYILKKFLTAYFFVELTLVMIICVINITEKNDNFIAHNLSLGEIVRYFLDFIPWIGHLIMPIAVFIATIFITSQMAMRTEIIAMLSGGMSFLRVMVPYMIGAVIIALISFIFNAWIIPNANKGRIAFERTYVEGPFSFDQKNTHMQIASDMFFYVQSYNNNTNKGYYPTVETIVDNKLVSKLSARRIEWDSAQEKWRLDHWTLRKIEGKKETFSYGNAMDTVLNVRPKDFESFFGIQEMLTLGELDAYIAKLRQRGSSNVQEYITEKYVRFMSPFAIIILTFIGLVVSARKSRGGIGFQIAIGFIIAFVFIICFLLTKSFATNETINPLLAVWLPNIIFSIVGFILYKTVPR